MSIKIHIVVIEFKIYNLKENSKLKKLHYFVTSV